MHKNLVADSLSAVIVGNVIAVENLLMFPLLRSGSDLDSHGARESGSDPDRGRRRALDYTILDDALKTGSIEITEVSAQGSVPELLVVNRGPKPVLIIDGEELTGAKQNRVVNLTIMVPAVSTLTIPVSCVEAGRWRARSKSFAAAPRTQYATGRAMRMGQVTRSIVDRGERLSDQSAVWAHIAEKSARMEARSATSAMEQIFNQHAESLDAYVSGCIPADGQCGALFAIVDGAGVEGAERRPRIVGFDLFDSAQTFRQLLPKLVRSYAIDAIDSNAPDVSVRAKRDRRTKVPGSHDAPDASYSRGFHLPRPERANASRRQAEALAHIIPGFLGALATAMQQRAQAVGMGDDVRLSAQGLVGAALVVSDGVVHVSGFSV